MKQNKMLERICEPKTLEDIAYVGALVGLGIAGYAVYQELLNQISLAKELLEIGVGFGLYTAFTGYLDLFSIDVD